MFKCELKKRSEEYVIDDQIMLMLPRCCLRFFLENFLQTTIYYYYYNYTTTTFYSIGAYYKYCPSLPHPVDMIPLFPFVQKRKKMNIFPSN